MILFNGDFSHPEGVAQADGKIRQLFATQNDQRSGYDYVTEKLGEKVKNASDTTIGPITDKLREVFNKKST